MSNQNMLANCYRESVRLRGVAATDDLIRTRYSDFGGGTWTLADLKGEDLAEAAVWLRKQNDNRVGVAATKPAPGPFIRDADIVAARAARTAALKAEKAAGDDVDSIAVAYHAALVKHKPAEVDAIVRTADPAFDGVIIDFPEVVLRGNTTAVITALHAAAK